MIQILIEEFRYRNLPAFEWVQRGYGEKDPEYHEKKRKSYIWDARYQRWQADMHKRLLNGKPLDSDEMRNLDHSTAGNLWGDDAHRHLIKHHSRNADRLTDYAVNHAMRHAKLTGQSPEHAARRTRLEVGVGKPGIVRKPHQSGSEVEYEYMRPVPLTRPW